MDVPDVLLVIQWKATCKLSTLWQRWGCAVRDCKLQGTAILFAEKDYFDDVREERHRRQQTKKCKADENREHTATRRRREDGVHEWENGLPDDDGDGDRVEAGEQELHEQLWPKPEEKTSWSARKKKELEPAMDCLINAHLQSTIQCQRKVFHVHFSDTSAGD
jgi:hypothetical protein